MAIVVDEDIRSGKPVVRGTRVAVQDVVERFYDLDRGLGDISSDLGISEEEAEEALRYYHREVVDDTGVEA